MEETGICGDETLLARAEAPKVPQPGKRSIDDPQSPRPPHFAPILIGGAFMGTARRDARLDDAAGQAGPQGIAVTPPIGGQPLGPLAGASRLAGAADGDWVEGLLDQGTLRRGRRVQVCSQRRARAIDQNHPHRPFAPLDRALAPLGRSDFGSPFSRR
jgi:hypothetical protein